MLEGYVIDWSIFAALFATLAAFVASGVTYFSSKRRHNLDARIEICKYREKWLDTLRTEMVSFTSLYVSKIGERVTAVEQAKFFEHVTRITLLINSSNSHWDDLSNYMAEMTKSFGKSVADDSELDMGEYKVTCEKILKEEWDEIQALLYKKKKKKNNAKNK